MDFFFFFRLNREMSPLFDLIEGQIYLLDHGEISILMASIICYVRLII